jgi:hypothetical protein
MLADTPAPTRYWRALMENPNEQAAAAPAVQPFAHPPNP